MKNSKRLTQFFGYLFLIVWSIISIFPFYWLVVGATNKSVDVSKGTFKFGSYLMENLANLTEQYDIWQVFLNTLQVTVLYCLVCVTICSLAAYGFSKYPSKIKNIIFSIFLLTMMIPFAAQMIPLYRLMSTMGLNDSYLAIILQGAVSVFLIFFLSQSFISFPTEIIEAARIDGASEIRIFVNIVVPAMKSTMAAGVIYAFMNQWNNYMWPLIILQSNEKKTMTLMISSMANSYYMDYGSLMLAIVIATIPMMIIFSLLQKQFVQGMTGSYR